MAASLRRRRSAASSTVRSEISGAALTTTGVSLALWVNPDLLSLDTEANTRSVPLYEIRATGELVPFRRLRGGADLYESEIESLVWRMVRTRRRRSTPVIGTPGHTNVLEGIGDFYVQFTGILCAYDLPGGAMAMEFTPNSNTISVPDGSGGSFLQGTYELTIPEANGAFRRSFAGGHNHMVDNLHFLAPGDGSGGIDEYCFCFIYRKEQEGDNDLTAAAIATTATVEAAMTTRLLYPCRLRVKTRPRAHLRTRPDLRPWLDPADWARPCLDPAVRVWNGSERFLTGQHGRG